MPLLTDATDELEENHLTPDVAAVSLPEVALIKLMEEAEIPVPLPFITVKAH